MFPVTVGGVVYNLADFYPFGYLSALPASIGSIHTELFKLATGTSSSSLTLSVSGTLVTQTGLNITQGQYLTVAEASDPSGKSMDVLVNSYDPSTGDVAFSVISTVGSGTYSSWVISPSMRGGTSTKAPSPVYMGGGGDTKFSSFREAAGTLPPSQAMATIFEDFTTQVSLDVYQNPWYATKQTQGSGTAEVSCVPMVSTDVSASNVAGLLYLRATGSNLSERLVFARVIVSYGAHGFLNAHSGGPIEWSTSARWTHSPSSTEVYRTRFGLKGDGSSVSANFFDLYGLGFEVDGGKESGKAVAVYAKRGQVVRVNTGQTVSAAGFTHFRIVIDPFLKQAYYYVNSLLVYTAVMADWPNLTTSLLYPCFSHETATGSERGVYFDYLRVAQRVNRRV